MLVAGGSRSCNPDAASKPALYTKGNDMEKVEFLALEKAMRLLEATGCKYRICTPGGNCVEVLRVA